MLTLGMLAVAAVYLSLYGHSPLGANMQSAVLGFLLAVFFTLPGYIGRRLGAADVKLFAAVGLLTSFQFVLVAFIISALSVLVGILVWYKAGQLGLVAARSMRDRFIPFGAALALVSAALMLWPIDLVGKGGQI